MKLTKKLEAEILKVYHFYWNAYLSGDMKTFASLLDDNCHIIGSTAHDTFENKKDAVAFYKANAKQVAGMGEYRNRKITILPQEENVMVQEICDYYFLDKKKWHFYGIARMSTLFSKKSGKWKIIHQHGSLPDSRAEEGQQLGTEKITKENFQLKEAIKRNTIELQNKNRELEIETALEKVRTVAMGMKNREDMLKICGIISAQLKKLGIKEIRNVQTAIFYPGKGTYMNYEYYAKHNKTFITDVSYTNHKIPRKFAAQMTKGKDEFFVTHIKGRKKVDEWINYQKTTNVFIDTYLKKASSLNYYWFSLGPVALGISTYAPLAENEKELFKRFVHVFELAYRRYLDIEKAEAQALEAKIEAALEKIRSRSLAMHKSDELQHLVNSVFDQLKELHIDMNSASIFIFEEGSKDWQQWVAASETSYSTYFHIPYSNQRIVTDLEKVKQSGKDFYTVQYSFAEKNKWFDYAFKHTDYRKIPEKRKRYIKKSECMIISFALSKNTGIQITKYYGEKFSDKENEILKRIGKVFEQAYVRFLDLQKAEAQAREAQIEAALERVRAASMAMHKSQELQEVIKIVCEQLLALGIKLDSTLFVKVLQDGSWDVWNTTPTQTYPAQMHIPFINTPPMPLVNQANAQGKQELSLVFSKKEKDVFLNYFFIKTDARNIPDTRKKYVLNSPGWALSFFFMKNIILGITTLTGIPFSEEENEIFRRFKKVFEQTYTRFLDLQKAEVQAREAQIEAALERVRSRSMGMQKSDELKEVIQVVYKQFLHLNINVDHAGFVVDYKPKADWHFWIADKNEIPSRITHPYFDSVWAQQFDEAKEKGQDFFVTDLNFEEKNKFYEELLSYVPGLPEESKNFYMNCPGLAATTVLNNDVSLYIENFSGIPYNDEENKILIRFGKVFQQTFTRFLDLQKAEAQAREAQVEAALEKVRSRTMAMQKSSELSETAAVLFEQIGSLSENPERINIGIINESAGIIEWWVTTQEGMQIEKSFKSTIKEPAVIAKMFASWKAKEKSLVVDLTGEDLKNWVHYVKDEIGMPLDESYLKERRVLSSAFFSQGLIGTTTPYILPAEMIILLERFAKVFDLTYTRFLDLKQAEEQAREATIEAALERVRSKAMSMHSSDDLAQTVDTFFFELNGLNVRPRRCGVGIIDKESRTVNLNATTATQVSNSKMVAGKLNLYGHPVLSKIFDSWLEQKEYHPVLKGTEIGEYYKVMNPQVTFPDFAEDETQYGYYFFFKEGGVFAWTDTELSEMDLQIFRRYTSVLSLTYKRYQDLKEAEARTKDALKQAALDRIRADIASMRTIGDLDRITPLIWNELTILGIPFIRCGVFIMDESRQLIHTFLSTPDGKAIAAFHLPYETPGNLRNVVSNWKEKKNYIDHWDEEEFTQFAEILVKQGALASAESYLKTIPHDGFYLHFLPFLQGMLYVGNTTQLGEEEISLIQSIADAFATAYARYEDFNKLEAAKKQVDNTLNELQVTQKQLIQSEKMASLGELTAGIAHEIQNPLNFVNNFSEVSNELLDEMIEEVAKGNFEEVKEILNDVKQNLEKINHHGKRADGIVKGMLQHSRTGSGQKELTDMNVLADEYLRLAYHGLRAKDKSFNATMQTEYEEGLEKVKVIPQEMGRVILNLITNAFYVVNEKKKSGIEGYEPTVSVSTKKVNGKIEIKVADNGSGIPESIKEKIFQPFFTTKPTGQGTGLGLSLAYDIVKAHSGELKVETKEGEGTEFIIQLRTN